MNNKNPIIPSIGLGTLRLCGEECISTIRKAIELGYQHFESALSAKELYFLQAHLLSDQTFPLKHIPI